MTDLIVELGMAKRAADTPEPTFLQQFGILSNAMIIDKFPNLADYRVAFQLILKNDLNTKALGVSVNRLDKQFIHVPSFFNNGKIKTGDMMYVPSIDMFRPMSDAWLADVRNLLLGDTGTSVPVLQANAASPGSVRVKLSTDPIVKTASLLAVAKDMLPSDIFSTAIKMGKKASAFLVDKLHNDKQFLSNVLKFYKALDVVDFAKRAAVAFDLQPAVPAYLLITPIDKRASLLTDELRLILFALGYFIRTNPLAKKASLLPTATTVLDVSKILNFKDLFTLVSDSCVAQLMDVQGDLHKALVISPIDLLTGLTGYRGNLSNPYTSRLVNTLRESSRKLVAVLPGDTNYTELPHLVVVLKSSILCPKEIMESYGTKLNSAVQLIPYGAVIYSAGTFYRVPHCFTRVANSTVWRRDCYDGSDATTIAVVADPLLKKPIISSTAIQLPADARIIMPSGYRQSGVLSTDLEHRKDRILSGANCCTVSSLVLAILRYKRKHYNKVKVYTLGTLYIVTGLSLETLPMQVKQAALHLVTNYGVHPRDARLMLKRAMLGADYNHPRRVAFYLSKSAADHTMQDTLWLRSNISMTATSNQLRPDVLNIDLDQFAQDPLQLMLAIQVATDQGIKLVFDVTAMKLLAQASDISLYIGDYVSDFLKSLDKLCRMLFMLYHHGDIMLLKYGTLKMKALLLSIKNSIDSLSLLTVFLKLRGFGGTDLNGYVQGNALVSGQML